MDINEGKEILTLDIIKNELITKVVITIGGCFCMSPIYILIVSKTISYSVLPTIFMTPFILLTLIGCAFYIYIFFKTKLGQLSIRKAVLYKKESPRDMLLGLYKTPHRLFFDRGGHFDINRYTYYKWSHSYSMNKYDLFESSRIDDHFILATVGKKTLMVYNDKFFDTSAIQYSE